jgi:FAD/FMN-containing dehydrogenase
LESAFTYTIATFSICVFRAKKTYLKAGSPLPMSNMGGNVVQVISALRQTIPQAHLVTPNDVDEYQALNNSYLSGFESDITPACIFLPQSKEEVAAFVQVIEPCVGDVQFAIRAAGRQPLPGCANVQHGITVDLRSLKGVELQEDGVVRVGAGENWGAVYEYLEPHGLGVTGGKSTTCGIGGLATQGKYMSNNLVASQ